MCINNVRGDSTDISSSKEPLDDRYYQQKLNRPFKISIGPPTNCREPLVLHVDTCFLTLGDSIITGHTVFDTALRKVHFLTVTDLWPDFRNVKCAPDSPLILGL